MAKNSFFNIGKSILNELKDKLVEQGKETLNNSKDELLTKGKETLINVANDKVNELSKGKINLNNFIDNNSSTTIQGAKQFEQSNSLTETFVNKDSVIQRTLEDNEVSLVPKDNDSKYNDSAQFENNLHKSLESLAVKAISNPKEAALMLSELGNLASEVAKFTEVQKTKRKEIEVQRDMYVSKITAQKEVLMMYLEKTFDERKDNFNKMFKVVDHALATNNAQALAMGLDSINQLAASSPFKDLASIESTQKALENKDHIWDI